MMLCQMFGSQYVISDQILGKGSFSSVYLATNHSNGKQVVCKVTDLARSSQRTKTLRRCVAEAEIMSQLDHVSAPHTLPNFATYVSHSTQPNLLYFHNAYLTRTTV
jgi:serine/threonine protein kinase